jgi:hypothetical protein
VTQPDFHVQDSFERSSALPDERRVDMQHLLELRQTSRGDYMQIAKHMLAPKPEDLETLLPRASLPKLTDGEITVRYKDVQAEDKNEIAEAVHTTSAASAGRLLLELIKELEDDDPEFIIGHFENMSGGRKVELIMALHVTGGKDELRDYLIGQLPGVDDFLLGVQDQKALFLDNEYFPLDDHLHKLSKRIASAYIMARAPVRQNVYDFVPDEEMRPYLEFARKYDVDALALEHINTRTPIPRSLQAIHVSATIALGKNIEEDVGYAQWMHRMRLEFDYLNEGEKREVAERYLELLAKSYGIYPAPQLEVDREMKVLGAHRRWDLEDKEESFAHPFGRIAVPGFAEPFNDFLETLSHEFTHSLEDAALYSINPEFQEWCRDHPDAVRLGDEKMQMRLKSAAFALSFNTACNKFVGFAGTRQAGYADGVYYSPRKAEDDPSGRKQEKIDELYSLQLRERHAHLYEYLITNDVGRTLDEMEKCRDPLRIVMMGQNGRYAVSDYIKDVLMPAIPVENREEYEAMVKKMNGHFNKMDARETSYADRMTEAASAFTAVQMMIVCANSAGFQSMKGEAPEKIFSLSSTIIRQATLAARILSFKEEVSAAAAKKDHGPQQAPA